MFLAVDRVSKFTYVEFFERAGKMEGAAFPRNILAKAEPVVLLNIQRKPELNATQNLISLAIPIAVSRLSDIRSHAPCGVDGLMTADDYGEEAAA